MKRFLGGPEEGRTKALEQRLGALGLRPAWEACWCQGYTPHSHEGTAVRLKSFRGRQAQLMQLPRRPAINRSRRLRHSQTATNAEQRCGILGHTCRRAKAACGDEGRRSAQCAMSEVLCTRMMHFDTTAESERTYRISEEFDPIELRIEQVPLRLGTKCGKHQAW